MTNKAPLILYTGTDCHLCDLAKNLLTDLEYSEINVQQERQYFHQYGARIPVLKNPETDEELPWPFDPEQLLAFLQR